MLKWQNSIEFINQKMCRYNQIFISMACDLRLDEHTAQMYVFSNIASFGHVIHKNEHIKIV